MKAAAVLVLAAGLAAAGPAHAANLPDPRLDAAASSAAGHPVAVWCETDPSAWLGLQQQYAAPGAGAFTEIGGSTVFLGPDYCSTLRFYLGDPGVATVPEGAALLVLLHEASHAAGVVDEHAADCRALPLVAGYAESLLGVAPEVTRLRRRTVSTVVRVRGRRLVRRTTVATPQTVPNPQLGLIVAEAQAWHDAEPGRYRGAC